MQEDQFVVFDLHRTASQHEIRKRYLALVRKWHPDAHSGEDARSRSDAEKEFKRIQEAYSRVSGRQRALSSFQNVRFSLNFSFNPIQKHHRLAEFIKFVCWF